MKKIYTVLGMLATTFAVNAQVASFENSTLGLKPKVEYAPKKAKTNINTNTLNSAKIAAGLVQGRFDPMYSLPIARQKTVGNGASDNIGIYVDPMFADSTSKQSFSGSGDSYIDNHKVGVVFDPTSIIFDPINFTPLLAPADSYILDTVWIAGIYTKKTNNNDTLNIEIIWGDTTATSAAFNRYSYATPLTAFGAFLGPKFISTTAQRGDRIRMTAPSINKIVIKRVLTDADTAFLRLNDYLPIVVNGATGQLIPAKNKVACTYAFVSGNSTFSVGAVSYAGGSSAPSPSTINGWASIQYAQKNPVLNTLADVGDGYDDFATGKNSGIFISKRGRYNQETGLFATTARNGFYFGNWIDFSIRATSTVGLKNLSINEAFLSQNVPNPTSGTSTVSYQLVKEASSVIFTVSDVMGRVISSEKAATSTGAHTITLGSYAAGVYYYSINVDGKSTTKKMIAQ